jgi:hypothetical protein
MKGLTRGRYLGQWPAVEAELANHSFDSFKPMKVLGSPNDDFIDPADVQADLDRLDTDVERLREYAERTRAHRTTTRGLDTSITFADLHKAIGDTREIVSKYYALLTLRSIVGWEPEPQYDTFEAFKSPWIIDADAVARKLDE